jgi:hypothetical protein
VPTTPSRIRVAIEAPDVKGDLAPGDRASLIEALEGSLASDAYELVATPAGARGPLERCETDECRRRRGRELEATHVIETRLSARARDYTIAMQLWSVERGEVIASAEGRCEICGLTEVRQLVISKAGALRLRLSEQDAAPATVRVTSEPLGSMVRLDGRKVGVTPYVGEVDPGHHVVAVSNNGFFPERNQITATRGVREDVHLELDRVPRPRVLEGIGWASLGTGMIALGGGVGLLAIDGHEHGRKCDDPGARDADGDCRYVHRTFAGGLALTIAGATLSTAGITMVMVDRKRRRKLAVTAGVGPRRVSLTMRF